MRRPLLLLSTLLLALTAAACGSSDTTSDDATTVTAAAPATTAPSTETPPDGPSSGLIGFDGTDFGEAPAAPDGALSDEAVAALDLLWASLEFEVDPANIRALGDTGDVRLGWIISDLLRFLRSSTNRDAAVAAFSELTGVVPVSNPFGSVWQLVTDHLIAWDTPAFPGYTDYKARLFTIVEPGWEPFFDDQDADIDWRLVSWGGVLIDNRPLGDPNPCERGCIPALDDPVVTDAAGGAWYADERIVFGVVIDGEARAYPKHQMEVHEMVNDTLGGRRIGMPYCTLCGSAQAFLTDELAEPLETPVLRTSGLLSRSNKVMYDRVTSSVFDTFTGRALSGPLLEAGVQLNQVTVVASTWGDWKAAYPQTTILAEDGGIGRTYDLDPLGGRDDDGPIFPIGDVDGRLGGQDPVIGVILPDGRPIAFSVQAAQAATERGDAIVLEGVTLTADGSGFRATGADGELAAHQAFWFAWSQFHPDTLLWDGS